MYLDNVCRMLLVLGKRLATPTQIQVHHCSKASAHELFSSPRKTLCKKKKNDLNIVGQFCLDIIVLEKLHNNL